ncbi:MAG: hypothetical protein WBM32_00275 [Crocosphaera sp.]
MMKLDDSESIQAYRNRVMIYRKIMGLKPRPSGRNCATMELWR